LRIKDVEFGKSYLKYKNNGVSKSDQIKNVMTRFILLINKSGCVDNNAV